MLSVVWNKCITNIKNFERWNIPLYQTQENGRGFVLKST